MRFKYGILLSVLLNLNHAYAAVTVGASPGFGVCDYTTISAALSSGDSEVRIVEGSYSANLFINHSVSIIGGYSSCTHAESNVPDPTDVTFIFGDDIAGESTIKITLNSTYVNLTNLYIRDAFKDVSVPNGGHGVHVLGASGTVTINNSTIANNNSAHGGGIYVKEVAATTKYVNVVDSSIFANNALGDSPGTGMGGGIYCSGTGTFVSVYGESDVTQNFSDFGGGIAAEYGCVAFVNSGIDVTQSATKRGVMNNTANINGGGVYIGNGSRLDMDPTRTGGQFGLILGDRDVPATLAGNSAGGNGGGVYAEFNSELRLEDVLIHDNSAEDGGGAVFLSVNSKINSSKSGYQCWNPHSCLIFSNNRADKGGGIYFSNTNAQSSFIHTDFYGNRANDGSVMQLFGVSGLMLYIESSVMHSNGNNGVGGFSDFSAFRISGGAEVFFEHVTIVDNDLADASAVIMNTSSQVYLTNSIFHNNEIVFTGSGSALVVPDCLIVNDNTNVMAANVYVEADPGFVDRPGHEFHLSAGSVAVDLCDRSFLAAAVFDHDGEPRGLDILTRANVEGSYDAGSDEFNDFNLIFKDDFE